MTALITRQDCLALDVADRLAPLRSLFDLPPDQIYLDGNSLGPLPRSATARMQQVLAQEWGEGLVQSWTRAGWIDLPRRVGDKIARLLGAGPGEVIAADSTSLNLYKVLSVALAFTTADAPDRKLIVSERDNFPTDLYMAQSLATQHGFELRLVAADEILDHLDGSLAVLMLTHVNYRTGGMHDMARMSAAAHAAGALVVWDLCHSVGAVPLDLRGAGSQSQAADFAVGCGYKYLNGGPGAPAFAWMHPRHAARMDAQAQWQPLSGWFGHEAPFAFTPEYRPAPGVERFACGTPSILALAALECGVDTLIAADTCGGMTALREKSLTLTDLFLRLVEQRCTGYGFDVQTPRDPGRRGSQVSLLRSEGAFAIIQALIARGVVGDYRAPAILRFGLAPLYLRHVDVWDAIEHLVQVLQTDEWRQERFHRHLAVT